MRRTIPSVNALLAFDAAARHQSFTRAAAELVLTESAISRQVANLESTLGVKLFERLNQRVTLTQAGQRYSTQVKQSLERMERDTLEVMAHEGQGGFLELAVLPTFASQWLIPRLVHFQAQHPGITLNLSARTGVFLFDDSPFDAAIHFGHPTWPGTQASYLFTDEAVPVCAPALWGTRRSASARSLAQLPLLHSSTRPEDWRNWFAAEGVSDINAMKGPRMELHSMLISAACCGLGVALVPHFLVAEHLARGTLLMPVARPVHSGKAYYLVCPEARQSAQPLGAFRDWLLEQAQVFAGNGTKPSGPTLTGAHT